MVDLKQFEERLGRTMEECGKASEQAEERQKEPLIPESPTSLSALMELLAEMRLS